LKSYKTQKESLLRIFTKKLDASYRIQVKSISEQLEANKLLSEQQIQLANEQIKEYKSQLSKKQSMTLLWVLVVAACVVGILIGRGCNF